MSSADPTAVRSRPPLPSHRSYLYAPGDRPELLRKALRTTADAVVFDLEDAVSPSRLAEARTSVREVVAEASGLDHGPAVHVRVARDGAGYRQADVEAAVVPGLAGLRVPKVESPEAIARLDRAVAELERDAVMPVGATTLTLTVESAAGALSIAELIAASDRVVAVALGASDLLADLGASGDEDRATLFVRSQLVLVCRAAGIASPIDSVHTDLDDDDGLAAAARRARELGFHGKSVIHPRQIAAVHDAFTPTDDELREAQLVVDFADRAAHGGRAAGRLDGRFVDPAVVARARAVLARRHGSHPDPDREVT